MNVLTGSQIKQLAQALFAEKPKSVEELEKIITATMDQQARVALVKRIDEMLFVTPSEAAIAKARGEA